MKLTRTQQVDEILKCGDDPIYFIKTYLHIQHPVKGRLPFHLYPFQEDCIRDFCKYKKNIILKSRQLGLSTTTAAYCLWKALFRRDQNIIIVATKLEVGKFMVQKIRTAFQMLPKWMLDTLELTEPTTESVKYVSFNNGSKITAIPTAADAGRGEAVSLLIVDEAAHVDGLKELWLGLQPTISTGGSVIVFSTPNGKGNYFHELWVGADISSWQEKKPGFHATSEGPNGFHAIKLPWMVHPERNDKWFEDESKSMDSRGIAQELLVSFESSGHTYFNQTQIDDIKTNAETPVAYSSPYGKGGNEFWLWRTPVSDHKYLICADVSRGDAEDFSAFHVVDMSANEVAGEYLGKIPTDEFGVWLVTMAKRFNNALIVQEKNTFGIAVANALRAANYPNLWYEPEIQQKMEFMSLEDRAKQIPGFTTTPKNRETLLQNLEEVVRNKKLRIYSTRFGDEMDHFIWTGKRGQAMKKKHDDLIMALAIGLQVFTPNGSGDVDQHSSEGMAWHMAFLKSISIRSNTMSTGVNNFGTNAANPFLANINQPRRPNSVLAPVSGMGPAPRKPDTFMGKELKVGVKRENVETDYAIRREYDWLFR